MSHQTPLYEKHLAANGKMVDFAGFCLPINYGSQLDEHHSVRQDCGMFDVSHMNIVDISGRNATAFMRKLIANDIAKLTTPYKALYSCMLNETGGVIDDLIVYFIDVHNFRLVVNAATGEKDMAWIKKIMASFEPDSVSMAHQTELAMIAIQGPNAIEKFNQAMPGTAQMVENLKPFNACAVGSLFIARTGYTGEDGLEVMIPAKSAPFTWQMLVDAGVKPCGLGARDTLRLEAGMSLYGHEMDEDTSPIDAGLNWTVDTKDKMRDFVGKIALKQKQSDLVGLVLEDKGIMRDGQIVRVGKAQGVITSGGFSPSMEKSIALARIPTGAQGKCEIQMRNKWLKAKVVKPIFVRNGKIIV